MAETAGLHDRFQAVGNHLLSEEALPFTGEMDKAIEWQNRLEYEPVLQIRASLLSKLYDIKCKRSPLCIAAADFIAAMPDQSIAVHFDSRHGPDRILEFSEAGAVLSYFTNYLYVRGERILERRGELSVVKLTKALSSSS